MSEKEVIEVPRLRKAEMDALGRVFEAEIEDRLPLQSKAKIFEQLKADGFVEFTTINRGRDRFGSIDVKGYVLTHAGRLTFCMNC